MSARTLAWTELTGPHLSRHLADRQAEKDWAKFRPGPEPTWEEVREAWMAGGVEHRRQVGGCECPYVRAQAAANAEKGCDEDLCGGWSVQGCYEASGYPGFCACDWTCGDCSSNVTAVLGATLYPRREEARCNRVGEWGRHRAVQVGYAVFQTSGFLIWPILGRPTVVGATWLPVLSFPLRTQVILADGTLGRPSVFWWCARHPVEFNPSAQRFQLFSRRGKPRFRDAPMPTPPPQGSPSPPPPFPAR